MKVIKAGSMGFCAGVRNAVRKAEQLSSECGVDTFYVYGDLAHNNDVMKHIRDIGGCVVYSVMDVPPGAPVLIRAHGITDADRRSLIERGAHIVDATCPNVLNNQNAARESDKPILLLGLEGHSEVVAIEGSISKDYKIIEKVEDVRDIDSSLSYNIIVQTTFDSVKFDQVLAELDSRGVQYKVLTRICMASAIRRKAIVELYNQGVEAIFVVGARRSANTMALLHEAETLGLPSFIIEQAEDVCMLKCNFSVVGLTAGSSTPDNIIEEVKRRLESL